jgi:hypothetical protein
MTEFSWFWTTVAGGPAGDQQLNASGYTQAMWADAQMVLAACNGFEGVAPSGEIGTWLAGLCTGSVPGANTARISAGGAMVDGHGYKNTANVDTNIPSSAGGTTRIDRLVLRCSWANFTVRITKIAGSDNVSPTAPAITQTPGTTYDIKLYQCLVNSSGTVVLTDERVWGTPTLTSAHLLVGNAQNVPTDVAVTGDVVINNAGVTAISSGVIVTGDISPTAGITGSQLAAGANIAGSQLAAAAAILATQLAGLVANRQGGDGTNWNTTGTNNYTPATSTVQIGSGVVSVAAANYGETTVTYPVAFASTNPVPVFIMQNGLAGTGKFYSWVIYTNTSQAWFKVRAYTIDGSTQTENLKFYWIAIGPT